MTYDFDIPTERHGTDCLKFDRAEKRGRSADLLSLWVADMDFPTAPEIVDAIIERTKHGIFGYTEPGAEYFAALDNWLAQRYGWHVTEDEVTVAPGVVYALAMAVRAFTEPGDAVIIQQEHYNGAGVEASRFSAKGDPAPLSHLYESIGEMPHLHETEKALQ